MMSQLISEQVRVFFYINLGTSGPSINLLRKRDWILTDGTLAAILSLLFLQIVYFSFS